MFWKGKKDLVESPTSPSYDVEVVKEMQAEGKLPKFFIEKEETALGNVVYTARVELTEKLPGEFNIFPVGETMSLDAYRFYRIMGPIVPDTYLKGRERAVYEIDRTIIQLLKRIPISIREEEYP